MVNNKNLYILSLFLILFSCKNKNINDNLKIKKSIVYPSELKQYLSKFPKLDKLIFFDSIIVKDTTTLKDKKLPLNIVELLIENLSSDELTEENGHYFSAYRKIEDSKLDNKYDDYIENLDIGMIQDANAYGVGRVEFGDSISMLLWSLNYESYPACPFFVGKHYFVSLVYLDKIISTKQTAAYETSADAPVVAETIILGEFIKPFILKRTKYFVAKEEEELIESGTTIEVFKLNNKLKWIKEISNGK